MACDRAKDFNFTLPQLTARLTSTERIIFVALLFEFTQADIATRLQCSRAAVSKSCARIRAKVLALTVEVGDGAA